ncbi:uncharacterized protein LOC121780795 isoform X2 [Salvia splendens]|uniref:uncharacterized protein LOC121780795 isoform X2 n=1 Tax=Salvia splendens TaxID=180675 RepID=UPI001C267E67|nr:uncharacterized protein LOC121780795 isoform X2 [Salvia splendens]
MDGDGDSKRKRPMAEDAPDMDDAPNQKNMNRRRKYYNAKETLIKIGATDKFITSLMGKIQEFIDELVAEGEQVDAEKSKAGATDNAKDDMAQDGNGGTKTDLPHQSGLQIAKHVHRAKEDRPAEIVNLIQSRTGFAEVGIKVALAKTRVIHFLKELMDEEMQEEEIDDDKKVTEIKQDAEISKS